MFSQKKKLAYENVNVSICGNTPTWIFNVFFKYNVHKWVKRFLIHIYIYLLLSARRYFPNLRVSYVCDRKYFLLQRCLEMESFLAAESSYIMVFGVIQFHYLWKRLTIKNLMGMYTFFYRVMFKITPKFYFLLYGASFSSSCSPLMYIIQLHQVQMNCY